MVSPTTDRAAAIQAIDDLKLDERTATGEAITSALKSIETFTTSDCRRRRDRRRPGSC